MCLFFNYRNSKEQHIKILHFELVFFCVFRSEIFLIFTTMARIQSNVLFESSGSWSYPYIASPLQELFFGF